MKKAQKVILVLFCMIVGIKLVSGSSKDPWVKLDKVNALVEAKQEKAALTLLEEVQITFEKECNDKGLTQTLIVKGAILMDKWQVDSALSAYALAARHGERAKLFEETSYAYSVLAEVNRMRGYDSVSLPYNRLCAKYAQLAGNEQKYSSRLTLIGRNFAELNRPDSARHYFLEAVRIKEAIKDSSFLPIAYEGLAMHYTDQYFISKSVENYLKAIEISGKVGNPKLMLSSLNNLAHTLAENGQPQKAKPYAQQALHMADTLKLKFQKAHVLACLGYIAQSQQQYAEALKKHQEALDIYQGLQNTPKVLDQYVRLAKCAFFVGNLERAEQLRQKGAILADSIHNKRDQLELALLEAQIYFKQNLFAKSMDLFQTVSKAGARTNNIGLQEAALRGFSQSAAKLNNFELAHQALSKAYDLQDSINNRTQNEYAQKLEAQYQHAKQEESIVNLEHQNEIKDLKLKSNSRQILFFILLSILALLAAILGFYLFNNKHKSTLLLLEKNRIIAKALKEKDLLLREIHHRVKNNLQVISSLLKLQSKYIKDPNAVTAINEGRTRVRSMALIHQNLYQKENLTGVKVKQYFSKLLNELFSTYHIDNHKIQLNTQIEDLNLDVDTIVPIGLIINELVSNALKYAFPNNKEGILTIKLQELENQLFLEVTDNGRGISDISVVHQPDTFGYRLIKALGEKLEAKINLNNQAGTSVTLLISSYKKAA